jgi:hypothetical protein
MIGCLPRASPASLWWLGKAIEFSCRFILPFHTAQTRANQLQFWWFHPVTVMGPQLPTFKRIRVWVLNGTECFMLYALCYAPVKVTGRPILQQDVLERVVEALATSWKVAGSRSIEVNEFLSTCLILSSCTELCCTIILFYLFSSTVHTYLIPHFICVLNFIIF